MNRMGLIAGEGAVMRVPILPVAPAAPHREAGG